MLSLLVLIWKPPDLCKPSKGHSFFPAVAENIQEHFHFKSTNVDHEITSVQALLLAADTVWSVVILSGSRMDFRVDLMLSPPTGVCAPIIRPLSPAAEKQLSLSHPGHLPLGRALEILMMYPSCGDRPAEVFLASWVIFKIMASTFCFISTQRRGQMLPRPGIG